jgi:hypothetical protein
VFLAQVQTTLGVVGTSLQLPLLGVKSFKMIAAACR